MKISAIVLLLLTAWPAGAQKIDMKILKDQSYMRYKDVTNCDSIETTIEERICANLRLQREDSIMNLAFKKAVARYRSDGDTAGLRHLIKGQEAWEIYRYYQSNAVSSSEPHPGPRQAIDFMTEAADITRKRGEELRRMTGE